MYFFKCLTAKPSPSNATIPTTTVAIVAVRIVPVSANIEEITAVVLAAVHILQYFVNAPVIGVVGLAVTVPFSHIPNRPVRERFL